MTETLQFPDPALLKRFDVTAPVFAAETGLAKVWKVRRADDSLAALKIYKRDMDNEVTGFTLLRHWNGTGAARLYDQSETAVLIEWLNGPSLTDLIHDGQVAEADATLVDVAMTLHAVPSTKALDFDTLDEWFQSLFAANYATDVPASMRATLQRATTQAQELLANSEAPIPLHGDLHHDNVRHSARGPLAFDAKGVLGDRHFDLANAFRNPLGAEDVYSNPAVIARRSATWAATFGTTPKALLQWAAAQSALSLCWTVKGIFTAQLAKDVTLIDRFFEQIDQAP